MDILLHPRLPPLVRPLPPMENISLFRVEESEMERELRTMLGLATPEDPEPTKPSQSPPQSSSEVPENSAQVMETTSLVPSLDPSTPPTQLSNDMQVEQTKFPPDTAQPEDPTPVRDATPALNPTPSTVELGGRLPLVPEPSPWSPIGFAGDEEEEEEIPSINMDSDSD